MAIFRYTARGSDGAVSRGQVVAATERELAERLRQQGLTLTSARPANEQVPLLDRWLQRLQGVPVVDKIFFTQNLGVMLRGGFSISRALGVLALQTNHRYFQHVILSIESDAEAGQSFSQALRQHPRIFNELFVNMIAAGEVSGKLDEVLKNLTVQMKKDHQLISKVRGSLTYPIIVVVAMIGAAITMMTYVIPKLLEIFEQNQAQLPLPTRILIAVSNAFQHYGLWLALGILTLVGLLVAVGRTRFGRLRFDSLFLALPVAGSIIRKVNLARFARSLSSMLSTDIPIIQSFQIISRTLSSIHYRQSMEEASQALRTGAAINKVLGRYPKLYPPLVEQMVAVGEESGTLDEVSKELASFFEEEVDQTMSNLSTIIEPVLLLILGAGVAAMAVAILLPIYSLSEQIT